MEKCGKTLAGEELFTDICLILALILFMHHVTLSLGPGLWCHIQKNMNRSKPTMHSLVVRLLRLLGMLSVTFRSATSTLFFQAVLLLNIPKLVFPSIPKEVSRCGQMCCNCVLLLNVHQLVFRPKEVRRCGQALFQFTVRSGTQDKATGAQKKCILGPAKASHI